MLPGGIGANEEDVEPAIKVVIQSLFLAYNEAETKHRNGIGDLVEAIYVLTSSVVYISPH